MLKITMIYCTYVRVLVFTKTEIQDPESHTQAHLRRVLFCALQRN